MAYARQRRNIRAALTFSTKASARLAIDLIFEPRTNRENRRGPIRTGLTDPFGNALDPTNTVASGALRITGGLSLSPMTVLVRAQFLSGVGFS
jgi:hypothetical protein